MATATDLAGLGLPPLVAERLGFGGTTSALVGAGTTSADALQLASGVNIFATVASGSGAKLVSANQAGPNAIVNGGANALLVYPATGEQINNATATTGTYSIANGKTATFWPAGPGRWVATLST